MAAKTVPLFEHTTCSRCGGCGEYSYNSTHGRVCFGCGGSGLALTKRGKAAQAYLREITSVPAGTVKPGDLVRTGSITCGGAPFEFWGKVVSVKPSQTKIISNGVEVTDLIDIEVTHPKFGTTHMTMSASSKIRRDFYTAEEKKPYIDRALAYQASLTKAGKLPKRSRS